MSEVLTRLEGAAGILALNRPRAIHALTHGMVGAMSAALIAWRDDPAVGAVIVEHSEGRGFCAGGDVVAVRSAVIEGRLADARRFFFDEYRLNHLIFTYPKPIVAMMDGVTMGGGVGIALPARFRVATENTRLAMPESAIGFFPDVGGGWDLSRLRGRLGPFLALTGARLDGAEALWAGLATHYLPSSAVAVARERIVTDPARLPHVLDDLAIAPPPARLAGNAAAIDRLFASDRYEGILAALADDGGEWAMKELATLHGRSPLSCKVALRQLAEGARAGSFAANLVTEYRLACRMVEQPDFAEGVRAVLVDKDQSPRWNPAQPDAITDAALDALFAPLPAGEEWTPLP
ncbi:MAG: enoyl-CoA hydratase/isomerase family protein [Novosphingobium sp.]